MSHASVLPRSTRPASRTAVPLLPGLAPLLGCGGGDGTPTGVPDPDNLVCSIPSAEIHDGGVAFPVALRGGVKFPGSDLRVDAQVIPLTEGQRDWELILEAGRSFHPAPLYRWKPAARRRAGRRRAADEPVFVDGQAYLMFTDEDDTLVFQSLDPGIEAFDTAWTIPITAGLRIRI